MLADNSTSNSEKGNCRSRLYDLIISFQNISFFYQISVKAARVRNIYTCILEKPGILLLGNVKQ